LLVLLFMMSSCMAEMPKTLADVAKKLS
jgi:hypothetical protein